MGIAGFGLIAFVRVACFIILLRNHRRSIGTKRNGGFIIANCSEFHHCNLSSQGQLTHERDEVAKYRHREIVEAEQFLEIVTPWPMGVCLKDTFVLRTREGLLQIFDGDWIITDVKGGKCLCKPDVFEATYEPV